MLQQSTEAVVATGFDPFAGPALSARLPLTESQREIWLAMQMHPEAAVAYNEGIALSLSGVLDMTALRGALDDLIARHELLRAGISPNGHWITVNEPGACALGMHEGTLEAAELEEMSTPFDLEQGPAVRFRLVRLAAQEHVLLMVAHHIMVDGWSQATLMRELGELYSARAVRAPIELGPASFQEYVEAEAAFLESDEGRRHVGWWLEQLDAAPAIAQLPQDLASPPRRSYAAGRCDLDLDPALYRRVRQLGAKSGVSYVATALAASSAMFLRSSGARDLVIAISAAGQVFHQREAVVGHCVNLLPLRLKPEAELSFTEHLQRTGEALLDGFEHQGATYGTVVSRLSLTRDEERPPLLAAMLNVTTPEALPFAGLECRSRTLRRQGMVFDWHFEWVADAAAPRIECTYNADRYSPEMVRERLNDLADLLVAACEQPLAKLADLPALSAARHARVTREWNATAADYPLHRSLHGLIREASLQHFELPAVMDDEITLTYAQLEVRAEALAAVLRRHGAGRDTIVGVCAKRSAAMPVALLAVLKAGAAYMPLDPDYPQQRLALMIEDAACPVILTGPGLEPELSRWLARCGTPLLDINEYYPPAEAVIPDAAAEDMAYVIFTSGSTGRPKGAMLEHRGIVNRLLWMQQQYPIGPGDKVLQKTPFSFDVSVWEFFWPMLTGATLVMAQPDGHKNPAYIAEVIEKHGISTCHFVPSMLGLFVQQPDLPPCASLRQVFCSGEALSYEATRQFRERLPQARLHNLYGPTEASVDVSWWPCKADERRKLVPIGMPVANTQLYVLDEQLAPVSVGVPGQLYLGGVQLARGYLKRPELTAERFITHPEFGRLYLTGDAARWLPDGAVDYLGRLDGQVKLRGQRIELGEIEARLDALPQVAESACAVRSRGAGDDRLIAWVAPRPGQAVDAAALAQALRRELPEFMIPQHIVEIALLPRLTSGKIDRKALPDLAEVTAPRVAREEPRTEAERAVAAIWQKLLGAQTVSRDDRFFDLGGHSLLALQAVNLLKQRFGVKPSLRSVLMATVAVLAAELQGEDVEAVAPVVAQPSAALSRQEAFYFTAAGQRLFGILTRPATPRKSHALLFCQSWGMEYMRSHRALQLLCGRLAELGFHCLRFDWYGAGDSAGDTADATAQLWLRNVRAAAAELRARSGMQRIGVVGVRLGALLAAKAVAGGLDAASLLLWDPPADGASWLAEMRRLDRESLQQWNRQRPRSTRLEAPDQSQLFGMSVSSAWSESIAGLQADLAASGVQIAYSQDEAVAAGGLRLPDASCWSRAGWITRPWNPRASAELVAEHLNRTLS